MSRTVVSQDFVNSLFGTGTRDAAVVTTAYGNGAPNGYIEPADFTGGQMARFAAQWAKQWLEGGSNPACPKQDATLIALLARYMQSAASNGPLTMWVPQMTWQPGKGTVVRRSLALAAIALFRSVTARTGTPQALRRSRICWPQARISSR